MKIFGYQRTFVLTILQSGLRSTIILITCYDNVDRSYLHDKQNSKVNTILG